MHYTASLTNDWHPSHPGNHLGQLLSHPEIYQGIPFDVGGWLRLAGAKRSEVDWPRAVRNMAVQRKCRRIHFLHGTGLVVEDGTPVARYIVRYENGSQSVIPVRYGEHVRDWWHWNRSESKGASTGTTLLLPPNSAGASSQVPLRIFILTWESSKPGEVITDFDFVSEMTDCAPFLLAVTVED